MADEILVRGSVVIPRSELSWRFSRSSGPGGQGVNTTDSRVQLIFDLANSPSIPERLRERAMLRLENRDSAGALAGFVNRRLAELRLVQVLDQAFAPAPRARRPTKPTKGATDRRIREKKGRGATKRLRGSPGTAVD